MTNEVIIALSQDSVLTLGILLASGAVSRICTAFEVWAKFRYSVDWYKNKQEAAALNRIGDNIMQAVEVENRPAGTTEEKPSPAEMISRANSYTNLSAMVQHWFAKGDTCWFATAVSVDMQPDLNLCREVRVGNIIFERASLHKISRDEFEAQLTSEERISVRAREREVGESFAYYRLEKLP